MVYDEEYHEYYNSIDHYYTYKCPYGHNDDVHYRSHERYTDLSLTHTCYGTDGLLEVYECPVCSYSVTVFNNCVIGKFKLESPDKIDFIPPVDDTLYPERYFEYGEHQYMHKGEMRRLLAKNWRTDVSKIDREFRISDYRRELKKREECEKKAHPEKYKKITEGVMQKEIGFLAERYWGHQNVKQQKKIRGGGIPDIHVYNISKKPIVVMELKASNTRSDIRYGISQLEDYEHHLIQANDLPQSTKLQKILVTLGEVEEDIKIRKPEIAFVEYNRMLIRLNECVKLHIDSKVRFENENLVKLYREVQNGGNPVKIEI